jgi:hypothetical protein
VSVFHGRGLPFVMSIDPPAVTLKELGADMTPVIRLLVIKRTLCCGEVLFCRLEKTVHCS